jgi:regulator of ribonuclease activity A
VTSTCDIFDADPARANVCELTLSQFGGISSFSGRIATVRCFEDNVLLKQLVGEPGEGRVLVVDGGGSLHCALAGDSVIGTAHANGWKGIVINGCVRDSSALAQLEIGVKALGTCPRPSGKSGNGKIGETVRFGGIAFPPGAELYADDDGLVVLDAIRAAT